MAAAAAIDDNENRDYITTEDLFRDDDNDNIGHTANDDDDADEEGGDGEQLETEEDVDIF